MKVIDKINSITNSSFSYEILPPLRGNSVDSVLSVVEQLKDYCPTFINVTSHASRVSYKELASGLIQKQITKNRICTVGICGLIQNKYHIDTVAHLLCQGFSKEETEYALIELSYLGVGNIFALKGDNLNYHKPLAKDKSINQYAYHMVSQIANLKDGKFLDGNSYPAIDFCVGVAGYPEKHCEAANFDLDIQHLKHKVACGADYIITQMFFDNQKFFDFVATCRNNGITVPIIPGIKLIKSVKQLTLLPKMFHIDIPNQLAKELISNPEHGLEIGKYWMSNQIRELHLHGFNHIHCFLMNDVKHIVRIIERI